METNLSSSYTAGQSSSIPPATGSSTINVGTTERIASVLAGTALAYYAIKNWNSSTGKLLGITGLLLLKRGATGFCEVNRAIGRNTALKKARAIEARATFVVNKPKEEVYAFWRNLENLPAFMQHLEKVVVHDQQRSSWTAKLPGGVGTVSWEAEIRAEEPSHLIAWASLPHSTIDNAGEVVFEDAPGNEGTRIEAKISYRLPAGDIGSIAGKLINPLVEDMIKLDLSRLKAHLEGATAPGTMTQEEASAALDSLVE